MAGGHEHYNYFMAITDDPEWQKYLAGLCIAGGLLYVGSSLAKRLRSDLGQEGSLIPSEKPTLFGIFDLIIERFIAYQDSILGRERRKYTSFTLTFFLFIFLSNIIGLIPGMPAATTTVWINVGMALTVFLYFNYQGIKEHGFLKYMKHFAGPSVPVPGLSLLLPLIIFPLEILSTCLRIFTLNLRLYWNISADHIILGIFTDLLKIFASPVYILGTFVSFMQAFVFTTLVMVYILLATQHEEGHEDGHKSPSH
jgi:F-type H+-transporting ATPase subunit a